ncbi:YihY/virulence factor BrkB family protein [Rufibacter hautae]|uniref:YihY/virulence factor BrkB family protein n=1 Tax=Rufibacter hautae TaxID=2595005 RepID=A0A5B6TUX8_9BACT|nr:YihY/virulence factor BrkB family protein [Rufibacter hautae]KAA3440368.1 YihY/virulence factor BrkB family protein [Rufibacter hautae]
MLKSKLKKAWSIIVEVWLDFLDNNSFQKGAALAYYTIFALPPILIIMINTAGAIFGKDAVRGRVYEQLRDLLGSQGAYDIQEMVENINQSADFTFATMVGVFTLLVGATGVFVSLQESLNQIWGVKPKPRNEYLKLLWDRLLSFAMILAIVFLLLVSLVVHTALVAITSFLTNQIDESVLQLTWIANWVGSTGVVTFLFALIYKFLPDAKIRWSDVWIGALVTAVLFSLGKSLIGLYLGNSDFAGIYGAAGSVIVVLTWVFYTSQIVFIGAQFTLVYARRYGADIYPSTYAVRVINKEVEVGHAPVNDEPGPNEAKAKGEDCEVDEKVKD